ncbi:MAG: DUF1003 domain-containing protein [Steroidobacteraceae bacterium]
MTEDGFPSRGRDGGRWRFAEGYANFRGSRLFLLILSAFLAIWFVVNLVPGLPHFDRPDFGVLNVILSAEASLSVALLMAAAERQDEIQRRELEYLLHLIEANHAVLVGCDLREGTHHADECVGPDTQNAK